ncbi:MAG: helix-turn-helix transcriptional regulator [Flavobacteriales bacterium]|nr:helix-turn-helix transcriptional regulator [Flavobacteriales bacterium]MBK9194875.1 helix-turn-helix transcriptional regulator [Flavobacteriales bacterium]MBP6391800.1 helix-turn-helix transcriptional regulator [Flavobacteriales bacterium]MBP6696486.1 helix-turn-helix transcriptional regulator [Flavobacteriales bacterium]
MSFITLDERIGTEKLVRASELLKVAAHPQRLAILDLLGGKKRMCVSDLVEVLGIEQAILSQHLTLMRDKGLLGVEKEGKYSFYYLEQPGFLKIIKDLENCCDKL